MTETKIEEIMANVDSFPSMPGAGTKLLSMLKDPDTDASKIEDVLKYDPGLTANILKMTNSAYFGLPQKIGSVKQAFLLLGWKRVTQLVLASSVSAVLDKPVQGYNFSPGELWRHSIAVSITAEGLVKELEVSGVGEFFTTALLHDIGKMVLGGFIKEDLEAIEDITSQGLPFVVAEQMVLGTDHAEIGAKILTNWSFPPEVINAVRWHHDPDSPEEPNSLVDIVYLSNVLCQATGIGVDEDAQQEELSPATLERLGVEFEQLEPISEKVSQWVDELSDALTFK